MALLGRMRAALRQLISPPLFAVDFERGVARARQGEVPPGLLVGLSDVARDLGLSTGTVYGVRGRHGLTLDFSDDIPERAHQRLRNVLAVHRHQIKGG
jgi:hypothetical protein